MVMRLCCYGYAAIVQTSAAEQSVSCGHAVVMWACGCSTVVVDNDEGAPFFNVQARHVQPWYRYTFGSVSELCWALSTV